MILLTKERLNAIKASFAFLIGMLLVYCLFYWASSPLTGNDLTKANDNKNLFEERLHIDSNTIQCKNSLQQLSCDGLLKNGQVIRFNCNEDGCNLIVGR